MGNKNDYLTLEESAQMLDRPVSFLKTLISQAKLSAKVVGGRWMISGRYLDKLKISLPVEPEKVVHNFLLNSPPKKSQRVSKTEPTIKTRKASVLKSGASKSTPTQSEPIKGKKALDKQIRETSDQIRSYSLKDREAVRSGSHSSKPELEDLMLKFRQLMKQRLEVTGALSKGADSRKKQKKKKNKAEKPSSKSVPQVNHIREKHWLVGQIKALDHQIKLEAARYKEATQEGRFYDVEGLKSLISKRAALKREYDKAANLLGPLPSLVPASRRKAPQQKSKAPKQPTGQASSSSVPPKQRLSWQVLPPGEWSVEAIRQHYGKLQRQNPQIEYDQERIDKALSLNPKQWYVGKGEFEGYSVFTFAHTPKALLECPRFGNAIYIINSDWKRLSRKTKRELKLSPEVTKIVHKGDWFQRVKWNLSSR